MRADGLLIARILANAATGRLTRVQGCGYCALTMDDATKGVVLLIFAAVLLILSWSPKIVWPWFCFVCRVQRRDPYDERVVPPQRFGYFFGALLVFLFAITLLSKYYSKP